MGDIMKEKKNIPEIRFEGFEGEWEEKRIGELGDIVTGSTPSTQEPLYYSNHGIPWVTPTDITENITYHTAKYLSEKGKQVSRLVPKNSILVTCIASIGKNTMLGTLGSFNQQINGLIPDENKYNTYFLYTESTLWSNEMKRSAASGTMQIVNKKEFSELKTFIPTIEEQSQIGSYFQNLDKQITLEQQKHDKLVTLKKAMLEKMFPKEGASVPEIRFEGFEGEWEKKLIRELCSISTGKSNTQDQDADGLYPFFIRSEVPGRSNKYLFDCEAVLTIGDGNIGKVFHYVNGKFDLHQRVYKMDNFVGIFGRYFYYYFSTKFYKRAMKMTAKATVDSVRLDMISEMEIKMPVSLNEQKHIAKYFQNLDKLISLQQQKINKLKNIKKACLDKMFV